MQRFFTVVLAIAVLLGAAAFVCAPYCAFLALRSAAANDDAQGLAQLIDYDAVRAGLRAQVIGVSTETPAPNILDNPIGALQHALAPITPAPQVDAYLKAPALYALTTGEGRNAVKAQPQTGQGAGSGPLPMVRYWGVDRCRLGVASRDPAWDETVFTFGRQGVFKWRLVQIRLPSKVGAPATSVVAPVASH